MHSSNFIKSDLWLLLRVLIFLFPIIGINLGEVDFHTETENFNFDRVFLFFIISFSFVALFVRFLLITEYHKLKNGEEWIRPTRYTVPFIWHQPFLSVQFGSIFFIAIGTAFILKFLLTGSINYSFINISLLAFSFGCGAFTGLYFSIKKYDDKFI